MIIYAEILYLAAIIIVLKLAMPWRTFLQHPSRKQEAILVKSVIFLAKRCLLLYFLHSSSVMFCIFSWVPHLVDWIVSLLSDFSPLYTWVKNGCISSASSFAFTTHYLPSYFKCPHSGEKTHMFSSLPLAMSSWRMSSLQSTCKTIMSLWFNGPCLWVLILQQPVWKGADGCSLMWRTLS